ncbi:MAG: hypothetical protein ACR2PG_21910 [Hyphomicrobiaceae bacterium]
MLENSEERDERMARLIAVLESYGGDTTRWPVADRDRLEPFAKDDLEARELVSRERGFDCLLDSVNDGSGTRLAVGDRLTGRVMAAVSDEPPHRFEVFEQADHNVIDLKARRGLAGSIAPIDRGHRWLPAAALAACLVLGVFVGAAGYLETTASSLTELTGLDGPVTETVLLDDGFGPLEEDYL